MIDFLRSNTWCTQDEYKWGMTIAQVKLSSFDYSRVEYFTTDKDGVSSKKSKSLEHAETINGAKDLLCNMTDIGTKMVRK